MALTPEQELAYYRDMAGKINADPAARKTYLRLRKQLFPHEQIPEIDVEERLQSDLNKQLEERDKKIKELEERQFKKEFEDKFTRTREKLSGPPWFLEDDQIKAVDELIEKKGFPDLETAADYLRATTQPLKPSSLGLMGFKPTQTARKQRADFNERYKKIFPKPKSNFRETFADAMQKIDSGDYLKEM
jgi:hypothetical protein